MVNQNWISPSRYFGLRETAGVIVVLGLLTDVSSGGVCDAAGMYFGARLFSSKADMKGYSDHSALGFYVSTSWCRLRELASSCQRRPMGALATFPKAEHDFVCLKLTKKASQMPDLKFKLTTFRV